MSAAGLSPPVCVKEEPGYESASATKLNTEYEVTSGLEWSPEVIQRQDIIDESPVSSMKIEIEIDIVKQETPEEFNKEKLVEVPACKEGLHNNAVTQKTCDSDGKCKMCKKTFKSANSLAKHMVVHNTDLNCKFCNKTFVFRRAFKKHKIVCRYTSLCRPLCFKGNK